MMLIFNRISNLPIGVKAVKLLFWEARVHTLVRTDWADFGICLKCVKYVLLVVSFFK